MAKYEVQITQVENYDFEVEADNEQEAKEKAQKLFETNKHEYHTDSDGTTEAFEI